MLNIIVGHRGSGKSSFLKRIESYYQSRNLRIQCFDLDSEISKQKGISVQEIFSKYGESSFRQLEKEVFASLVLSTQDSKCPVFICVGAGFSGDMPETSRVLWVRRPTDSQGRIFIDRPRLDSNLSPLDEYKKFFDLREMRFRRIYDKSVLLSEGFDAVNDFEPALLGLRPADTEASITVLKEHLDKPRRAEIFFQDHLMLGIRFFEFRDDLLDEESIRQYVQKIPKSKVLISLRRNNPSSEWLSFVQGYKFDWALEIGAVPENLRVPIVSLHQRHSGESVDDSISRLLQSSAQHYKLSVPVDDFNELWSGHKFYQMDPEKRSFLPRSDDGRWMWYRCHLNKKMFLNFVRSDEGSSLDQPSIFDYLRQVKGANSFAAVLGDPVLHSHTPAEHFHFFLNLDMSVFSILMKEIECHSLSLEVLRKLGMKAAAVTSPLKRKMKELCVGVDALAEELDAVNTIVSDQMGWRGVNTDFKGMEKVFQAIMWSDNLAVWGGGGTRLALRKLLPHAYFFSARFGEEIWVEKQTEKNPEVLVWALGRSRWADTRRPPEQWRPQYVVDLNYTDDSPGLEYAQSVGAKYISGKSFFKAQALHQQEFWKNAFS